MAGKRLLWHVLPPYFILVLTALLLVSVYLQKTLLSYQQEQVVRVLHAETSLLFHQFAGLVAGDAKQVDGLCKTLGREAGIRITVVDLEGRVLGDSDEIPSKMDNHRERPEIVEALEAGQGVASRFSHTLQQEMTYLALPLQHQGQNVGVVRTAFPAGEITKPLQPLLLKTWLAGCVLALVGGLVAWVYTRRIAKALDSTGSTAQAFAGGDLELRAPHSFIHEVDLLAEALNGMALGMTDREQKLVGQKREERAVFSSMIEGVLIVDAQEQIVDLNEAAARLLSVSAKQVKGRSVQEVLRNSDLQAFISRTLGSQSPVEADIVVHDKELQFFQAHGTKMRDANDKDSGALVVLHDVTRLRKLETIRRDFVANVSHELKTPITTINGFVETLLDGALDEPEQARKFVSIVKKNADRLSSIIEDLLSLSRLEQEKEQGGVELNEVGLAGLLSNVIDVCTPHAETKKIRIRLECPQDIVADVNAHLFQQAVVNLVDNAIKHSPEETDVTISVDRNVDGSHIHVIDHGYGISEEHIPRLFERFYRVDKARSRELGGTGLGLAIVKHITQVHGGDVSVESKVEKGSVFSIHLPPPK